MNFRVGFCTFIVLVGVLGGAPAFANRPTTLTQQFLSLPIDKRLEFLNRLPFVTALKVMEEFDTYIKELKQAAYTDSLTGLANRRALSDLEKTSLNADGSSRKISVVSFDIDFFKKVNDSYGHAGGDDVLIEVAKVAAQNTRNFVYRKGGEEFEVILLDATNVEGQIVAERLRQAIEALQFEKYPALRVTASFGVASALVSSSEMFNSLQTLADQMAYTAKLNGRNQVQVASEKHLCELALLPAVPIVPKP